MTPEIAGGIATALVAVLTTLALIPKLFKGELVFKRDVDNLISVMTKNHSEILEVKDEQIRELRATVQELKTELTAQYQEQASGARELLHAIDYLRSLQGAKLDRRQGP